MSDLIKGMDAFEAEDYSSAFRLLKPIADEGNAEAQCIVGNMYHLGLGVERDILKAVEWYKKSAAQGYGLASNNLAGIFIMGDPLIPESQVEAEQWYQKALRQGFFHAPI